MDVIKHDKDELLKFNSVVDQLDFRKDAVLARLKEKGVDIGEFDAVVGRGGVVKPIEAGTYIVNEALVNDLIAYSHVQEHASTLGGLIAHDIAQAIGKPAFIADPICVDEFEDVARIAGLKEINRRSVLHALNIRSCLYRYAENTGRKIEDLNVIVAHLGGGISIAAVKMVE